jgi:C4-dicarboxylate transporter
MVWEKGSMSAQAIVWFVIAAGALVSALRVFNRRFIKKDRYAVGSGGGFVMFGVLMLLVAAAAFVTGLLTR